MDSSGEDKKYDPIDPQTIQKKREGGLSPRSDDLSAAFVLLVAILVISRVAQGLSEKIAAVARSYWSLTPGPPDALTGISTDLLAFFVSLFAAALLITFIQQGPFFTTKTLVPDITQLNPVKFFQRFAKPRTYVDLLILIAKLCALLLITGIFFYTEAPTIVSLCWRAPQDAIGRSAALLFKLVIIVASVFTITSLGDAIYRRFLYNQDMKISEKDLKQEYKNMEGDPLIRHMRKDMRRMILENTQIQDTWNEGSFSIVNPTHFICVFSCEKSVDENDGSEIVKVRLVAKGRGDFARKLREICNERALPMYKNPPLARALYDNLSVNEAIPDEFREAVQSVIDWVEQTAALEGRTAWENKS